MKHLRRFLAFFCALTAILGTQIQNARAQEPARKTALTVKGFFNVCDTMVYTYDRARFNTSPADTVCQQFEHYEFLLTVKEKSESGYLLHLIPMGITKDNEVKNKRGPETRLLAYQSLYGMHIEVALDRYGGSPVITNWQAVKERLMRNSQSIIDKLYETRPDLVEGDKKDSLRSMFNLSVYTREGIEQLFPGLMLLFSVHGDKYDIGKTRSTSGNTRAQCEVSTGEMGLWGYRDDFNIYCETVTEEEDGTTQDILNYNFFENGWPNAMQEQRIVRDDRQRGLIETKVAKWSYHSWENE